MGSDEGVPFWRPRAPPSAAAVFVVVVVVCSSVTNPVARAQKNQTQTNATRPTADPFEAMAVNSIFQKLGARATPDWNISGELCSGVAIGNTDIQTFNPGIKCDCSYNKGTLCHITRFRRIYALDVVGDLPDELWNLTFLMDLNLGQNYLTGPLPPSIGRLTRMQYLSVGINALSGELPKELGMLTDLRSLSFSTNNFSGSFPNELGNLTRLTQLYFDSSGVSGAIPPTFAKLQSLVTVWGSDARLTGQIPDFIGNWSQLTTLRFQGNAFHGRIPLSFSKLTSLTDLRISDLSNASSSLDFIRDMKSLSTLILRNNNISGSIPPNIGEYPRLQRLDLSFNNLSGRIPDSLLNLTSLTHLFLGNNKFTGSLPSQKSEVLQNIDLSYNELSGGFPSWVSGQNLQLNLVANNFTLSDSNSSLPSGLNCLQRNFPCNRGVPIYYNFSIRCGGPSIRSANGILYEADNATFGPATYYTTNTQRWAVSNTGLPADASNPYYRSSSSSQFTNTLDSELFQTARMSAGSLRYYGLGLENGNYTVKLQFAESQILDTKSWMSLGRRHFDIYVQGNRVWKDFDIKKEAGGRSFTAVQREFTAYVSENYLEVHLFWAGKGTCCVPTQGSYGPFISAISAIPDFNPTVSNNAPTRKKKSTGSTGLIVGIVVPIGIASFLSVFAVYFFVQRRRRHQAFEEEEFLGMEARPYTFSYAELRAATNDFHPSNKLGEGGFGPVFKGTLEDGRVVAVKQLSVASHQGKSQFVAEIATISAVQHRNLVKLYGCCIEGNKRLLVYEYLENKSLDQALFGTNNLHLDWPTRFDICLGVARGLAYLHEESRLRIVHRDVKASNILLDSDLNPKISDFGLAKLYDDTKTHISTRVAGTIGYLAPEYAMRGHLTEKADVFGFGVVALEIVSGRPNSDSNLEENKIYLLEWAWNLHENDSEIELVDSKLVECDENEVKRVIGVALLCIQASPALRPSMSRVVAMLSGDTEVTTVTTRPGYLTDWKFRDSTSFISSNEKTSGSNSRSLGAEQIYSPGNAEEPMISDILGDGR
ncbi:probable LRR receptor-like serine/threonine-protein kinase At1g56140 isoform X3 [Coffea arabica]|uniref:non-specific serine/threonine protein kinase n=1 Tax=Coffea arabica TaxID=13443 RepID=A0A6P6XJ35_COFAR